MIRKHEKKQILPRERKIKTAACTHRAKKRARNLKHFQRLDLKTQNACEKNTNTRTITPRIDEKNGNKDRMLQKKYTFLHSKRLPKQKKYHAAWDIKVNGNMGSIIILNLLIHAVKFLYHATDAYF